MMFGSFLLGGVGALVILASIGLGLGIIAVGGGAIGWVGLIVGVFLGFYLRYLSKHTTRIRR